MLLITIPMLSGTVKTNPQIDSAIKDKTPTEKLTQLDFFAREIENYNVAMYAADKYFEVAKKLNEPKSTAYSYFLLGRTNWLVSRFNIALENQFQALIRYEKLNDTMNIGRVYLGIGMDYSSLKEYQKSIDANMTSIEKFRQVNFANGIANGYGNSSETYITLGDFPKALVCIDSAIKYHRIAYKLEDESGNMGMSIAYENRASILIKLNNYDSAIVYLDKAIAINSNISFNHGVCSNLTYKAEIYNSLGKYQTSIKFLKVAEAFAKKIPNNELRFKLYEQFVVSYKGLGDFKNAFFYKESLSDVKDSINKFNSQVETVNLEKKLFEERMKYENELIIKEKNISLIIGSFIILLLVSAALILLYRNKIKSNVNLELEKINEAKNKLFALVSHDLKGPINAFGQLANQITDYYDTLTPEEIKEYLGNVQKSSSRLNLMMDNLLNWAWFQMNGRELHFDYYDLKIIMDDSIKNFNQVAVNKNIVIINQIDEDITINCDDQAIILIFSNLISNAIKFSYSNSEIIIKLENNNIQIIDFGVGIANIKDGDKIKSSPGTAGEKGTGLGIEISKEILKLHNSSLKFKNNEPKGTIVEIEGLIENDEY